jgi:hypothetical protein
MLMRTAYHRGPDAVLRTMRKHPKNKELQYAGFAQLCKFDYAGRVCLLLQAVSVVVSPQ